MTRANCCRSGATQIEALATASWIARISALGAPAYLLETEVFILESYSTVSVNNVRPRAYDHAKPKSAFTVEGHPGRILRAPSARRHR